MPEEAPVTTAVFPSYRLGGALLDLLISRPVSLLVDSRADHSSDTDSEPFGRLPRLYMRTRHPSASAGGGSVGLRNRRTVGVVLLALLVAGALGMRISLGNGGSDAHAPSPSSLAHSGVSSSAVGAPEPAQKTAGAAPSATSSTGSSGSHGAAAPNLASGVVGQPARVQESGSADLSVGRNDVQRAVAQLTQSAGSLGGFVADTEVQTGQGRGSLPASADVTLQVPEQTFTTLVSDVRGIGRVQSLDTQATDVTSQYVDLQARIDALTSSREQYMTIMSKATTIGDVLAVQSQLDSLQTQIEQLQGQLQVLDNETTYATLAVTVSQTGTAPAPAPKPEPAVAHAWHEAVHGFLAGVSWLVSISGPLLFLLLLALAVVLCGRLVWRTRSRQSGRRSSIDPAKAG